MKRTPEESRRLGRTPHRSEGWDTTTYKRLVPGAHLSAPRCYVSSPPSPKLHLRHPLSWFDPRAHVRRSSLYILAPAPLRRHKSFEKIETLIILRAPPYSRALLARLGLEGGKQLSLGFLIVSRAWFGIIFVPLSLLYLHYFYMLVIIVMTISVFILFMFFVIMFMVVVFINSGSPMDPLPYKNSTQQMV